MRFTSFFHVILALYTIQVLPVSAAPLKKDLTHAPPEYEEVDTDGAWSDILLSFAGTPARTEDHMAVRAENGYENTALAVDLPNQPDRMVQMLLSLIVSENDFTQEINEAIVDCLSKNSSTESKNWGLFSAERFTNALLQAEYFAAVSEDDSLSFPLVVDEYVRNEELRNCVFGKEVGLSEGASLLSGRTTLAHRRADIVSSAAFTPGWVVGALIGALALVALVGIVVISAKESRVYQKADYESPAMENEKHAADAEMGFDMDEAHRKLSRELKTIAGQRRASSVQ